MPLVERQLLGHAEGPPRGKDGDLRYGISVLGEHRHKGVAGLVDGHGVLLLWQEGVRPVSAPEDDPVSRLVDVGGRDDIAVVADGDDRRLVDEVGEIGT